MERVWAKFASHEDARRANYEYYRRLSPRQRLDILLELMSAYRKENDAASERLERVCRVSQLQQQKATGRTQDKADIEALGAG